MTFRKFRQLVAADMYRYEGAAGCSGLIVTWTREPRFRLTTLMRSCRYLRHSTWGIYHFVRWRMYRLTIKILVYIDPSTEIGPGLYIPHPCGIVVNRRCEIGADLTLSQNVTLGRKSRPPNEGCPSFGDRVDIGPGAVIIGNIKIGNDAAVGANCVDIREVPPNCVVAGVPGKIISNRGSKGYVTWQSAGAIHSHAN